MFGKNELNLEFLLDMKDLFEYIKTIDGHILREFHNEFLGCGPEGHYKITLYVCL